MQQIIDRDYVGRFDHYKGNIIAVGINYVSFSCGSA